MTNLATLCAPEVLCPECGGNLMTHVATMWSEGGMSVGVQLRCVNSYSSGVGDG